MLQIKGKDDDGILQCLLKTVDLNDNPPPGYHRLSYTWGNPRANGTYFR
jgi:hypothetical protein